MSRYPQKRSAVDPRALGRPASLRLVQPEGIRQAAAVMGVTPGYLESVATFYDLFRIEPQGEHQVLVCTNISCWLRGADELLEAFATPPASTGRGPPRTASSSSEGFECLGACDIAPMASIDERYYGPLTEDDATDAVEQLRNGPEVAAGKRLGPRRAGGPRGRRQAAHPAPRQQGNEAKPKGKS